MAGRRRVCKIAGENLAGRDDGWRDFAHAVCSLRTRQRAQNRPETPYDVLAPSRAILHTLRHRRLLQPLAL